MGHGSIAGRVTKEMTAWCFKCEQHTGSTPGPLTAATKDWHQRGWRKSEKKWYCPRCRPAPIAQGDRS